MAISAVSSRFRSGLGVLLLALAAPALGGCPAVYPEISTRMSTTVPGQTLEPGPPDDILWLKFLDGRVPPKTRDGRSWDAVLGSLPDPYARILVNDKEIMRTGSSPDTLTPSWPSSPRGNYRIHPDDRIRVELWDANALNDQPIGIRDLGQSARDYVADGVLRVDLEGGGELRLAYESAHAMFGLGLWFELRSTTVYITRLSEDGPAARAGIEKGDQVLTIGGRDVKTLSADEVRSAFNAVSSAGVALDVMHADKTTTSVVLEEGPIYATVDELGPID